MRKEIGTLEWRNLPKGGFSWVVAAEERRGTRGEMN
jgi:hypothetical protein